MINNFKVGDKVYFFDVKAYPCIGKITRINNIHDDLNVYQLNYTGWWFEDYEISKNLNELIVNKIYELNDILTKTKTEKFAFDIDARL